MDGLKSWAEMKISAGGLELGISWASFDSKLPSVLFSCLSYYSWYSSVLKNMSVLIFLCLSYFEYLCQVNWIFCNRSYACVRIIFINMFVLLRLLVDLFISYLKSIRKFSSPLRTLVTMVLLLVYSTLPFFLWLS